jgi:hypothetical protein
LQVLTLSSEVLHAHCLSVFVIRALNINTKVIKLRLLDRLDSDLLRVVVFENESFVLRHVDRKPFILYEGTLIASQVGIVL